MCTAVCNAAESVWMALDSRRSMRMNAPVDDSVVDSGLTRAVSSSSRYNARDVFIARLRDADRTPAAVDLLSRRLCDVPG